MLYIPWTEDIFDFNLKSHQQFYERILKVTYKDKVYWLSPGSRYFPANMMDFAAKGVRVAVVNEDGASLEKIPLDEYTDNMSSRVATVTFDPDEGTATIDVTNAYNPYQSYYKRSSLLYFDTDAERKESIEEDLKDDFGDETVLNSISFENLDDIHKPVIITMSYTINYEFEELGDQIIMDFPGFNSPKTNPFLDQDRHSNIFFNYPYEKTQEVTYKIPEGFSIVSVPENAKVRSQVISFKVDYEKISDTELKVKSTETLKRNMMSNSAVKMLKRKYNKIVEIRRNKVVLQEL